MIEREERGLEVAGVELHVVIDRPSDAGAGSSESRPPIVVLHGFTGDASTMAGVVPALAARREVVRVDLVGHGSSEAPRDVEAYRMERCLDQLEALCRTLAIEPAHWLGYSMGGRTALCLAAFRPQLVRSLVLVGASAGLATAEARAERMASDEALAARIESDAAGEGLEAFVDHWMALPLFASQKRLGEAALASARAQRLRNRPHGLANSLRGMGTGAQPPLHAKLSAIDLPVALAVGDEDAKFLAIAADLEFALVDARVLRVPEAGHAAHLENPDFFAREVARFLDDCDARSTQRP